MASSQIFVWDHVFSLCMHTQIFRKKTISLLLKDKLNGESEILASVYLFFKNFLSFKIYTNGIMCMLFTLNFTGQIRNLFL